MKKIKDALSAIKGREPLIMAVAGAADEDVVCSVCEAERQGIVLPVFFGDKKTVEQLMAKNGFSESRAKIVDAKNEVSAIEGAAKLVSCDKADVLMKGQVNSGAFLRSVLHPEYGLRSGDTAITAIAVMESAEPEKLLFITDLGFIPAPDLQMKKNILLNAVQAAHKLGIECPKVAPLCASEAYNPKIAATADAKALEEMNLSGEFKGCVVSGPISLDLAISEASARQKGFDHPVAGKADILLMPSIEAGNILYKSLTYYGKLTTGGIMAGTRKPVVFMSRSDDAQTKLNTIILAAYMAI